VAEDTVPVYKSLLKDADLILPNQFEAELLSDVKITDLATMKQAITKLHQAHRTPHILITSIRLPPTASNTPTGQDEDLSTSANLSVIGSTVTSDMKPRLFRVTVPALPVFFSGTGDMFASLMVSRLRQAAHDAGVLTSQHWRSPDDVAGPDLPLAKAAEKVLASMHAVLKDTADHYFKAAERLKEEEGGELNEGIGAEASEEKAAERHLKLTRAAEVRVTRNVKALVNPPNFDEFRAQAVAVEIGDQEYAEQPDELSVTKAAGGEGAIHRSS
jgi:pyridoxine kinase